MRSCNAEFLQTRARVGVENVNGKWQRHNWAGAGKRSPLDRTRGYDDETKPAPFSAGASESTAGVTTLLLARGWLATNHGEPPVHI